MDGSINYGSISGNIQSDISVSGGSVSNDGTLSSGVVTANQGGTYDYTLLNNKPTLNGETMVGDMQTIVVKTTAEWAEYESMVSEVGVLYVYSDAETDSSGNPVPKIKVGNGNAYVGDLAFTAGDDIRISEADIANWNSKVSVRVDGTTIIFY